ncbi:hypothetical protein CSOJ01_12205 [Colletotrichum sojae]|uniref:Uncharacterized protein n=1 Tax=Colletotrichum sojae TaxID=2175907 RepID=A0A8H6IVE7_9PEZI|nr:hypothetical protein CSOJ01_12205 [Colletotrichum sojae]
MARPARHNTPILYGELNNLTTPVAEPERLETIDLNDLNEHIKTSRPVPTRRWPKRQNTDDYEEWQRQQYAKEADAHGHEEWPRYSRVVDSHPSAHPKPLRTGIGQTKRQQQQQQDTNFLNPPTPDANDRSFDKKEGGVNDTTAYDSGDEVPLNSQASPGVRNDNFVWWTFGLWLLGVVMVVLTTVYSTGSAKALMRQNFFVASQSNSLLILRIMTELCAIIIAAIVVVVVEDLQWALASRPGGVSLLHFVGLDSGTGVWGLLRLLMTADWRHKYSSLFRLLVLCSIPLPGVLLMSAITYEMVSFPEMTYPVSAGVGPFNASYIYDIGNTTATALLVQMGSPAWSDRDSFSLDPLGQGVGKCTGSNGKWAPCDSSYLLTGGVVSIAPQLDDLKRCPEATTYVVPKTRVVHLEYGQVNDLAKLRSTGKCFLLGSANAASYWCAGVGPNKGLLFGSAYCPISLQLKSACLTDTSWTNPLQLSSSLFVYYRHATVTYDRGNFSILAVTDMTPPVQDIVSLEDYMLSLSAVVPGFNASNAATNGDNSALAIYAVTALPINESEVAKKQSLKAIRKAMSVPFSYFHSNYFSKGPSIWELKTPREGLDADMYTELSISVLSHQVVAGKVSRYLFVLISGTILLLSAGIIVATSRVCGKRPQRCGYPTLDFAAVCAVKGGMNPSDRRGGWGSGREEEANTSHTTGLHRSLTQLGQKPEPFKVAKNIKNDRVIIS